MKHIPVLVKEVLEYLDPKPNCDFIDCTLGLGGHAKTILDKTKPKGKLLAIEQNQKGLNEARKNLQKYKSRITYINGNFANLDSIARSEDFARVSGVFFDLGLASWQIEEGGLGISYSKDEPLDMRLGDRKSETGSRKYQTAEYIINKYSIKELADIFYKYADVRNSWSLARRIELARRWQKIRTTFDLVKALKTKNPKILAPIFQALRITVNGELDNLEKALKQAINLLKPSGRLVVISYHSGEDRIVKNFFKSNRNNPSTGSGQVKILTKKPILASQNEVRGNPRARSAKLRCGEKI